MVFPPGDSPFKGRGGAACHGDRGVFGSTALINFWSLSRIESILPSSVMLTCVSTEKTSGCRANSFVKCGERVSISRNSTAFTAWSGSNSTLPCVISPKSSTTRGMMTATLSRKCWACKLGLLQNIFRANMALERSLPPCLAHWYVLISLSTGRHGCSRMAFQSSSWMQICPMTEANSQSKPCFTSMDGVFSKSTIRTSKIPTLCISSSCAKFLDKCVSKDSV
mmetsp:Transcript_9993/g.24904  ORF Transcript_9993/g.24904 Transcript_9993/m.24904 type:complete len:223 (+) Transcript_9993:63-731(+)